MEFRNNDDFFFIWIYAKDLSDEFVAATDFVSKVLMFLETICV